MMIAACAAVLCSNLALAQPVNDDCPDAIPVFNEGVYAGSSLGSTNDGFSQDQFCAGSASDVWYKFVAPFNGILVAHLCAGANFDTILGIWNGCPQSGGVEIDCNNDSCGMLRSIEDVEITASQEYWIRVAGWEGESGNFTLTIIASEFSTPIGPDVVLSNMTEINHYSPVGGTHAYITDSHTCNVGTGGLAWGTNTPLWTWNAYRLEGGRLEQIGMSWVKHGISAVPSPGCGMTCLGDGGTVLGAGCRDVYSADFNADQGILGPRSQVNAFTGAFPGPSGDCDIDTSICKRLQIAESDLDPALHPDALYFFEVVFVAGDDAAALNAMNNASHKRVSVDPAFSIGFAGAIAIGHPAITAWRDHGLGLNTPDPDIALGTIDVSADGRFHFAHRVKDLGGGQWRYEYALFNLNSHRAAASFHVPVPAGVAVSNVGFHDVAYHSGEPINGTDWAATVDANGITWACTETFAANPNANALRYATMYTFWFDAGGPPAQNTATIGLFRPGDFDAVFAGMAAPSLPAPVCQLPGDVNVDLVRNGLDISHFVNCALFGSTPGGDCICADMDGSGGLDDSDMFLFVNAILAD